MQCATPEELLEIKKQCIKKVEHYILLAEKKLNIKLPMPQVRFSISGGVAGRAWCGRNVIEFNPTIIRLNPDEFLGRTPGHEVAHLIAYEQWHRTRQIDPHGTEWRRVMWAFSLPAIRCHNFQIDDDRPKKRVTPYRDEGKIVTPTNVGRVINFD